MNIEEIAEAWIEMWSLNINDENREKFDWVGDYEYEAIQKKPEEALNLILAILKKDQSNHILEVLSAGPLEDLLAYHGETIIDNIEFEAKKNKLFANLLGGVWQNNMSSEMWKRIQMVWDRSQWDGNS